MPKKVTEQEAIADIQRVAHKLGKAPTVAEYREYGNHSVPTVAKHFDGSFVKAREAAGVADGELKPNSREELLDDIRRVAEIVGGEPSKDDYKEHGNKALSTITYRFDSWIEAKKEAGVYDKTNHSPTKEMLIEDLQDVDANHSGPVTERLYNKYGEWTARSVQRHFEGWEHGCQVANVTRPHMGPKDVTNETILENIRRVKEDLGHYPSKAEYNEHELSRFTEGIAKERFGSWMKALRAAGFDGRPQEGARNPNFNPDYYDNYPPVFNRNRLEALERDNYQCQHCGMDSADHISNHDADLEAHHIYPHWLADETDISIHATCNLVMLCDEHHGLYEGWFYGPDEILELYGPE